MSRNAEPSNSDLGKVHFLGLAGVGVSAVARIMMAQGMTISGTDAKDLPVMGEFTHAGVPTFIGYDAKNLDALEAEGKLPDTVVASSIAQDGNPEYEAARSRGLKMLHRSEALAATMAGHKVIAVAGTHGKTTTSSMAATALRAAGVDPTFAIGANLVDLGLNAAAGSGPWFVAEADESDGSLLNYFADVVVLTNVEPDHLDHYGTDDAVYQVFRDFVGQMKQGGTLIYCADDKGAAATAQWARNHREDLTFVGYGFSAYAEVRITETEATAQGLEFTVSRGENTFHARLQMPGNHNVLNAVGALLTVVTAQAPLKPAIEGLAEFSGAARRFQFAGAVNSVRVFDDYAHHPTEVRAALQAARSVAGSGKVRAIFQPHLFSRTQEFATEFAHELSQIDDVVLLEIYPAREEPIAGVTSELISQQMDSAPQILGKDQAVQALCTAAEPGDIILTLGAGDVTYLAPQIVAGLETRFDG